MVTSLVCIFLLSDNFFFDERALKLMKRAVNTGKTCVILVTPGSKWWGPNGEKAFP